MSDNSQEVAGRRGFIKKGALAATMAVGGVGAAATAGSAASGDYFYVQDAAGGNGGDFKIIVKASGFSLEYDTEIIDSIEKSENNAGESFLTFEGSFFGDKRCKINIHGYEGYHTETSDDGVDIGYSL